MSNASSAGGPPVEVPTRTRPSPDAGRATAVASRAEWPTGAAAPRRRCDAAPFPGDAGSPAAWPLRPHAPSRRASARIASMRSDTAPSGFGTKSTAPSASACSVASAPSAGQRRHHDDRTRSLHHDPVETLEAVHVRHVHVERDDVGREALELVERLEPVAGESNLEIGFGRQDGAEQLAHQRGVVDHEDLDHAFVLQRLRLERVEKPSFGARQQLRRDRAPARCGPIAPG